MTPLQKIFSKAIQERLEARYIPHRFTPINATDGMCVHYFLQGGGRGRTFNPMLDHPDSFIEKFKDKVDRLDELGLVAKY